MTPPSGHRTTTPTDILRRAFWFSMGILSITVAATMLLGFGYEVGAYLGWIERGPKPDLLIGTIVCLQITLVLVTGIALLMAKLGATIQRRLK